MIQGPHQKSTKNTHAEIVQHILSDLKDVKFGTPFPRWSKIQNHLVFLRKNFKKYYFDQLH